MNLTADNFLIKFCNLRNHYPWAANHIDTHDFVVFSLEVVRRAVKIFALTNRMKKNVIISAMDDCHDSFHESDYLYIRFMYKILAYRTGDNIETGELVAGLSNLIQDKTLGQGFALIISGFLECFQRNCFRSCRYADDILTFIELECYGPEGWSPIELYQHWLRGLLSPQEGYQTNFDWLFCVDSTPVKVLLADVDRMILRNMEADDVSFHERLLNEYLSSYQYTGVDRAQNLRLYELCDLDPPKNERELCRICSGQEMVPYILRAVPKKKRNSCKIKYGNRWSDTLRQATRDALVLMPKLLVRHIRHEFPCSYVERIPAEGTEIRQYQYRVEIIIAEDFPGIYEYHVYDTIDDLLEDGWVVDWDVKGE